MNNHSGTAVGVQSAQVSRADHLTVAERAARGKAERATVPRRSHADWNPAADRPDPIALLEEQATSRIPELVPIRYGRMLVSPFAFFRGAAYVMASDLSTVRRTSLHTQLCGDAHLSNFGAFAAPDRRQVFSLNDFDETLPGPFEWDLKRLVASFAVAARERGFDAPTRALIVASGARAYRETMRTLAAMRNTDVWYARIDVDVVAQQFLAKATSAQSKRFNKGLARSRTRDSMAALNKLTRAVGGEPKIGSDPPLIVPLDRLLPPEEARDAHEKMQALICSYEQTLPQAHRKLVERYRYVDSAHKVVGVGSVGTRAWIVLLLGRDNEDPLFLQAKEACPSVLEPFIGKSEYTNHGQRVVEGQRIMQPASDIMLGWLRAPDLNGADKDFYLRQLWDAKGTVDIDLLGPRAMMGYANLCGSTLARAHARSGDPIAIASYVGTSGALDQALISFAERYADQNERDYSLLKHAVASRRVEAATGL